MNHVGSKVAVDSCSFAELLWYFAGSPESADEEATERVAGCKRWLDIAETDLRRLEAMTEAEAAAAMAAERRERDGHRTRNNAEVSRTRARYVEMLARIADWQPPTPEHEVIKASMTRMVRENLEHCREEEPPPAQTPTEWRAEFLAFTQKQVERTRERLAKAKIDAAARRAWYAALEASVPRPGK